MNEIKEKIYSSLSSMEEENKAAISALSDRVLLTDYAHLAYSAPCGKVWTEALRQALREHEIVEIPTGREPYYIDDTVVIPSGRRIEAWRATLCLTPECRVLMFRNAHAKDGTKAPIDTSAHRHKRQRRKHFYFRRLLCGIALCTRRLRQKRQIQRK